VSFKGGAVVDAAVDQALEEGAQALDVGGVCSFRDDGEDVLQVGAFIHHH
jgi:hypothetical protein